MTETAKEAAHGFAQSVLAKGYRTEELHTYTDAEGKPLYWRIRAKHPATLEKWIRPMKLNGQIYELAEPKFSEGKPLYGLHRIASNPDAIVWIVEGEQKADALHKLGEAHPPHDGVVTEPANAVHPHRPLDRWQREDLVEAEQHWGLDRAVHGERVCLSAGSALPERADN